MFIFAFLCIAIGVFPQPLYDLLPYPVEYEPYTADHLVTQFQLLLFAGLAFFLLLPMMKRTETISLDFDWFYRKPGAALVKFLLRSADRSWQGIERSLKASLQLAIKRSYDAEAGQPKGYFAKLWPTETMVVWVAVLLAGYLMIYYLPDFL
jgi:multicomponent Na+:H+ antiporter subunit D